MQSDYAPESLDVASFSATASRLQGVSPLEQYPRLAQDCLPAPEGVQVRWLARGLRLALPGAGVLPALHLQAQAELLLACQLCLGSVHTPVTVDRRFAFAASEEAAARLDEQAEDVDVLALAPRLNLHALIEDELLMALPLTPRHANACPEHVPMSAQSEGFDAAARRPSPFAALAALKDGSKSGPANGAKA